MRCVKRLIFAALMSFCWVGLASAQYPTRPITIIVPFAAGGPSDSITRLIADRLGRELGQRVIVLNVGGAGGTVGTNRVVTATPDGYTLLSHHIGLATAPALYKSLPFDPLKDLTDIGLVAEAPMAIVARKDFPPDTLPELIKYVQQNGEKITYASAGIGGASFLCGLLFAQRIDAKFTNVAYTGTGPAYTDMLAGRTDFICDLTTGTNPYIQSGGLKPYALAASARFPTIPTVPTTAEAGLPDFTVSVWYGLYAPPKTPAPIVDRLSKALQAAMLDKSIADKLALTGTSLVSTAQATPEALHQRLDEQIKLWSPIIEKSGVSVN